MDRLKKSDEPVFVLLMDRIKKTDVTIRLVAPNCPKRRRISLMQTVLSFGLLLYSSDMVMTYPLAAFAKGLFLVEERGIALEE